jgi:hypothetical protein
MSQRDGALSDAGHPLGVDSFMQNLYIDKTEDGRLMAVKRPGYFATSTPSWTGPGTPTGLFWFPTGAAGNGYFFGADANRLTLLSATQATNNADGTAWTAATTPGWVGRRAHNSCVFDNRIWVIGGRNNAGTIYNDVWFSADGETWTQATAAAPWTGRQGGMLCAFGNKMYYMGGLDAGGNLRNDVWASSDGVLWTLLTSSAAWAPRSTAGLVANSNGMFLVGGITTTAKNDIWFSSDGATWAQLATSAAWAARYAPAVLWYNNLLYVIGGFDAASAALNDVWASPDGITWTQYSGAAFAVAPQYPAATVYEGKIWVFAGDLNNTKVYSSATGTGVWTLVTTTAVLKGAQQCTVVTFRAPSSVSQLRPPIMWQLGGMSFFSLNMQYVARSDVNGAINATWTLGGTGYLPLQAVPVNNNQTFFFKDVDSGYVFAGNTLTKVSDLNYPKITVPGVVNLNEIAYVMDPSGLVYGSARGNALVWPSLNFIGADFESDPGVAIAKYVNYVVAFGTKTTQFFYDAGAPEFPVLRPIVNANLKVGCALAYSVTELNGTLFWVGTAETSGRDIYMMQGMQAAPIGTPFIKRIVDKFTDGVGIVASGLRIAGHSFYILTDTIQNVTLVYDVATQQWATWTVNGNAFNLGFAITDGAHTYMAPVDSLGMMLVAEGQYGDNGVAIDCRSRTSNVDHGTNFWKTCSRATLIGDKANNNLTSATINLRFSDDDYQTWSAWISIKINQPRPSANRLGRFRQRAWEVQHNNNSSLFRAEALELMLDIGVS